MRTFIELFLDGPSTSLAYKGRETTQVDGTETESPSEWKFGPDATKALHTCLEDLRKKVKKQFRGRPDGWRIPFDDVKQMKFLICFDSTVLNRGVEMAERLLLDESWKDVLPKALSDLSGLGIDVVFTLELTWSDLGEDPAGEAHPPLLTLILGIWGYRPATNTVAPSTQGGAAAAHPNLNSENLVKVLRNIFQDQLEKLIFEIKTRAGFELGYSRVKLFDVQPPGYFVANLTSVREKSTLTSLLNFEDDFDMALQEILQGGETFGSKLEGNWLFFRKHLARLNEKRVRSLSLFVPRLNLTSSSVDVARFDEQVYLLAKELSYDEFWIINKANDARGILASVAGENTAIRKSGKRPSLSNLATWRLNARAATDYFRQSMGRVEQRLASWSFDQIPGLPDAKTSFLKGTVAVRYFEKVFGDVESDLATELQERLASDSYKLERAVYLLTYAAIIGAFVLAVLPFLLEKEWQLTPTQWTTIAYSGIGLLLILAVLAVLHRSRRT